MMRRWTRTSTEDALDRCSRIKHRNRVRWPLRLPRGCKRIVRFNPYVMRWK